MGKQVIGHGRTTGRHRISPPTPDGWPRLDPLPLGESLARCRQAGRGGRPQEGETAIPTGTRQSTCKALGGCSASPRLAGRCQWQRAGAPITTPSPRPRPTPPWLPGAAADTPIVVSALSASIALDQSALHCTRSVVARQRARPQCSSSADLRMSRRLDLPVKEPKSRSCSGRSLRAHDQLGMSPSLRLQVGIDSSKCAHG
jgi:hypothetical protein